MLTCDLGDGRIARFRFVRSDGTTERCPRHALFFRPVVRTAALTSLVVGSVLTAINQGDILVNGDWAPELWWKIPMTYAVPYCVVTWSALRLAWSPRSAVHQPAES